jgi:hypothetical protein
MADAIIDDSGGDVGVDGGGEGMDVDPLLSPIRTTPFRDAVQI